MIALCSPCFLMHHSQHHLFSSPACFWQGPLLTQWQAQEDSVITSLEKGLQLIRMALTRMQLPCDMEVSW